MQIGAASGFCRYSCMRAHTTYKDQGVTLTYSTSVATHLFRGLVMIFVLRFTRRQVVASTSTLKTGETH